jgi:hypothetical protein
MTWPLCGGPPAPQRGFSSLADSSLIVPFTLKLLQCRSSVHFGACCSQSPSQKSKSGGASMIFRHLSWLVRIYITLTGCQRDPSFTETHSTTCWRVQPLSPLHAISNMHGLHSFGIAAAIPKRYSSKTRDAAGSFYVRMDRSVQQLRSAQTLWKKATMFDFSPEECLMRRDKGCTTDERGRLEKLAFHPYLLV